MKGERDNPPYGGRRISHKWKENIMSEATIDKAFDAMVELAVQKHEEAQAAVMAFVQKYGYEEAEERLVELDEYKQGVIRGLLPTFDKAKSKKPKPTKKELIAKIVAYIIRACEKAGVSVDSVVKELGYTIS